jgi:hypothetical protein
MISALGPATLRNNATMQLSSPRHGTSLENRSYYEKTINGTKDPTQRLKIFTYVLCCFLTTSS